MSTPSSASETPARRPTIPHLPALDGLRGAAVLGVLFFHDDHLPGGYLGVDLFFVLSGFLITSLLLAEHRAAGRIDLSAFWIRRARRLFPAVLALIPVVALYAAFLAKPAEVARIRADGVATLAYFANWRSIFAGKSYWDLFNAPSPLEHTWSLSIEEQFYVVWPLLTALVLRRARKSPPRALLLVSLLLAAASAAAMWLLFDPDRTSRAYMGTDTRGTSILLGAALACLLTERPPLARKSALLALDLAGLAALAGLAVAWITLEGKSPFLYHGGFWLTELAVLVLIFCAVQGSRSRIATLFSIPPLRWMGLISYGLYLWHWPLYCLLTRQRTSLSGLPLTALRLAATLAISYLSYRFLEQPIRKRGLPFGRPLTVVPAAVALAATALLLGTRASAVPATEGGQPTPAEPLLPLPQVLSHYTDHIRDLPPRSGLPKDTLRVLVLGDSVAVALGDRLRYMQDTGNAKVAVRALGDCNCLDEQHPTKSLNNRRHDGGDCDTAWEKDANELRPDVSLVILGGAFFAPVEIGGAWRVACDKEWHDALLAELTRTLTLLRKASGKVVIARVPYPVEHWASEKWDHSTDCFNALVDEAAAKTGAATLPLKEEVCPGADHTSCILENKGAPIRPDGMHFQGLGAEEIARWTLQKLR
ncbi:MAG: acyltransferase [Polyangiaceae bacterium]